MKIIHKDEYKISSWSGGKTTELYIYPEDKKYSDRDFEYRLSSATVEVEKSIFTKLTNYNRILMILDGSLEFFNEDLEKTVDKFEQVSFDGGTNTTTIGKVTDFNVMLKKNSCYTSEVVYTSLAKSDNFVLNDIADNEKIIIYIYNGSVNVNSEQTIQEKDAFVCDKRDIGIIVKAIDNADLIITKLK